MKERGAGESMRKIEDCPDCRRYRRKCGEMEQNRVENAITRVTAAVGGEPKKKAVKSLSMMKEV